MRLRPEQVEQLAAAIVQALLRKGFVRALAEERVLRQKVLEVLRENLEQEAALEAEAEEIAEKHLPAGAELDRYKLVQGIKARLARERGFVL